MEKEPCGIRTCNCLLLSDVPPLEPQTQHQVTQVAELQLEEEEEVRFLAEKIFHLIDQNFILTSSVDEK